jgi:hypothetical protein
LIKVITIRFVPILPSKLIMNVKQKGCHYKNNTPDDGNYYNNIMYRFIGSDWISLVIGGGSAIVRWELRVRGNLTYREDTGLLNSSPVVNIPPLIRIQYECSHTIKIPGICSLS